MEDMGHIPSILLCNLTSLYGVHTMRKVTDFVIKFSNYLRKNLMLDNPQFTIPSRVEQFKLFSTNQFEDRRLQINQQDDRWSCGFHSLLARQNFLQLLLEGWKFNKEWFRNNKRSVVIDNMKDGKVDKIRNILLQILTCMAHKKEKLKHPKQITT